MSKWCKEHITEMNNWFVTQSGKKIEIQSDWKFCPICGTPRPEPRKGLNKKLRDVFDKASCLSRNYDSPWDSVALCALEHFVAAVDELEKVYGKGLSPRLVKQAMEDSLNG